MDIICHYFRHILILFGFSIFAIYLKTLGITIEGFSGISYDKKDLPKNIKIKYDGFIVDSQKIKSQNLKITGLT